MLPVQQPDLGSMFGAYSAGPTQVGWEQLQNARQNQAFNMAEAQRQQQEASAKAPFELQQLREQARKAQLDADYAEKKQPLDLSKLQLEGDKQSAEELNRLGYVMQQAAGMHKAYGGIPPYFQSKFPKDIIDALNSEGGFDKVMNAGKALQEHSSPFLTQDQKGSQAYDRALLAAAEKQRATEAANMRAAAANALKAKLAAAHNEILKNKDVAKDPKTWQALATKYTAAANNPNATEEERQMYSDQAEKAAQMQAYMASVTASAKLEGSPDIGAVTGLPTVKPKVAPKPTGNSSSYKKDDKGRIVLD